MRVLLIDPNAFERSTVEKCLRQAGCAVHVTDSEGQPRSYVTKEFFEVVLCHKSQTALDFARHYVGRHPRAFVVLFTGTHPGDLEFEPNTRIAHARREVVQENIIPFVQAIVAGKGDRAVWAALRGQDPLDFALDLLTLFLPFSLEGGLKCGTADWQTALESAQHDWDVLVDMVGGTALAPARTSYENLRAVAATVEAEEMRALLAALRDQLLALLNVC